MKIVIIIIGIIVAIIFLIWLGIIVILSIGEAHELKEKAKLGIIDNRYVTVYEQEQARKIEEWEKCQKY